MQLMERVELERKIPSLFLLLQTLRKLLMIKLTFKLARYIAFLFFMFGPYLIMILIYLGSEQVY